MIDKIKGPWTAQQATAFLQAARIPLRLACVGDDGFPRVVSVWYRFDGDCFHCVSHQSSQLVRLLRHSDRVGFEVAPNEPPYYGVRGQGIASLGSDGEGEVLGDLLQRFLGGTDSDLARWLLSRRQDEVLIAIRPTRLFSWDYRERMAGAA